MKYLVPTNKIKNLIYKYETQSVAHNVESVYNYSEFYQYDNLQLLSITIIFFTKVHSYLGIYSTV